MMQKIVIKVQMHCSKARKKAMQLAAAAGVESVAVEGEDKNQLVLIGDGIDAVGITGILRKKLGRADIIKVEEVKKEAPKPPEVQKGPECRPPICHPVPFCRPLIMVETFDPCYNQVNPCSIM